MATNFFASPFMSVPPAILAAELDQLEERARAINLSLAPLAARAGVRMSQIWQESGLARDRHNGGKAFRACCGLAESGDSQIRGRVIR